ncbi:DUF3102 domain-containing protein [Pelatocladus sp. BLCC-F211]|uniref:DUF3102 domain-containing protein n=1 Tax=Pelatocladus sp. BLCC-F211 TaxID=3342752 RepID=UPI0035B9C231
MNIVKLDDLAIQINAAVEHSKALYDKGVACIKEALTSDKEAGELLMQVKNSLPHGHFIPWIECNCRFSDRHARNLMNIAKNWQKILQGWEKMQSESETRFRFESPLPSLRTALAIAAAAPKEKWEEPPDATQRYKIASVGHDCYGEVVEVVEELHQGDVIVCKTSKGDFPFLKRELVNENQPLETVVAEIVEETASDIEDKSENFREAIALVIEYLPELVLKAVLAQALFIGRDYLPDNIKNQAGKLMTGGQEMGILNLT